jgi:hypothetical protein
MMSLEEWTDRVVLDLSEQSTIGRLIGDDWQTWGVQLQANTVGQNIPDPYAFQDWQEWAQRLCGVL